jgi:DNA-binding transcriptional ArsR family regulator
MAQAKTEEFSKSEIELAGFGKAIAHPARIKILQILIDKNACICGDIVDLLPLSQSTVSQHLKELKKSGLISGEIEGPKTCYCVNNSAVQKMKKLFDKYFA